MTTRYILIDYENVQPDDLALLNGQPFKLFVFLGANQSKIPADLAEAMQSRGENACYVRITGNGRNALDFHIALYLGELSAKDPHGSFHVISKDKGFDPLIQHLQGRGVRANRFDALSNLPGPSTPGSVSLDDDIAATVKNLVSRGTSRPRKRKTLASTIDALFQQRMDSAAVDKLIDELVRRGKVVIRDGAVSYAL